MRNMLGSSEGKSVAKCPYCDAELEGIPQRKKKCSLCNNYIYVRTSPGSKEKKLVTKEQAEDIDKEYKKLHFKNKWLSYLKTHGVKEEDFDKATEKLTEKFGETPSVKDIIWLLFNETISKLKDFDSLKMIYYEMALFLNEEKKDFSTVLQQSQKMDLLKYKQIGIKKVQILSAHNSCEACKKLNDKIFTVKDALEKMPLPCMNCKYILDDDSRGFCRCVFVPVF